MNFQSESVLLERIKILEEERDNYIASNVQLKNEIKQLKSAPTYHITEQGEVQKLIKDHGNVRHWETIGWIRQHASVSDLVDQRNRCIILMHAMLNHYKDVATDGYYFAEVYKLHNEIDKWNKVYC